MKSLRATGVMLILLSLVCIAEAALGNPFGKKTNISYGGPQAHPLQTLDIYYPSQGKGYPVVIFFHGGGWTTGDKANRTHQSKGRFFVENKVVFVSVNYRLAPKNPFPAFVEDAASSISFVFNKIRHYRGDPQRIFLMGHSAGAHLAALVSTDKRYLAAHQKSPGNLRGVILLDGAGYDIPEALSEGVRPRRHRMFVQAFGEDKSLWKTASPSTFAKDGKGIPPFLIFYVKERPQSQNQSVGLANGLNKSGGKARVVPIGNSSHRDINIAFGTKASKTGELSLDFIEENATEY